MFTEAQLDSLKQKLDPGRVKPPPRGKYGEYIEAWDAIDHANKIFGFDGWDRETTLMKELSVEQITLGRGGNNERPGFAAYYTAKVRVTVHAGDRVIVREGSGDGSGTAGSAGEAKVSAIKEAESDAMKRALMTFGYQFGLALYDKEKNNVADQSELTIARLKKQASEDEDWQQLTSAMKDLCVEPDAVQKWWGQVKNGDLVKALNEELRPWFFEFEVKPYHAKLTQEQSAA